MTEKRKIVKQPNGSFLTPFPKGVSGNPKGRPKGVPNTKLRLLRLLSLSTEMLNPVTGKLELFTVAEQMDLAMINEARQGNVKAYTALLDRYEGRVSDPSQTPNITFNQLVVKQKEHYDLDA